VVLYIIALPLILFLSLKQKYKKSIPARFFLFKNKKFTNQDGVWFHVCSLGEAKALNPILDALDKQNIKITTITQTGQDEAKKYGVEVRYLPFEFFLPFWIKRQKLLVILEAEFWYMLIIWSAIIGTKVVLLNARISDKSAPKYMKMHWFYSKMLQNVEIIYAQSSKDKERFLSLGAKNVEVIGNIKLAQKIVKTKNYEKPQCELIVAGSTHEGEEESILNAFAEYKKDTNAKLVIVPRHPERFESVYKLIGEIAFKRSLSVSRFSQNSNFESDITLVDVMGELNNIYAISDVAILGGSFVDKIGGHNPLEPATFGCKIITGKYFFHQKELFKYVQNVQYIEKEDIEKALKRTQTLSKSFVDEEIDLELIIKKIKQI
jgi:3-deoxy-D-manno-octulosonic-acid transferase